MLLRTTLRNAQDALNAIPLERHPFILKNWKRFDVCEVGMVETERRLKSEADDNLEGDPLMCRSAWLFGSYACVNAGNRDDSKTCSSNLVQ